MQVCYACMYVGFVYMCVVNVCALCMYAMYVCR